MEIHTNRLANVPMTEEEKRNFKKIEQQIIDIRANFIKLFGEALIYHQDKQRYTESIIKWGEENGKYFFHVNAPLDEALKDASYYREYILKAIRDTSLA